MNKTEHTVAHSAINEHIYKIFPNDLNSHKTVFGGRVMEIADRLALVVAERHSGCECVTASVDDMHFLKPAKEGDTLVFSCAVNRAWNTSMEIGVRVQAENSYTGKRWQILAAYFTFVAQNADGSKAKVPIVMPETKDEKRRYDESQFRRDSRLVKANQLQASRSSKE